MLLWGSVQVKRTFSQQSKQSSSLSDRDTGEEDSDPLEDSEFWRLQRRLQEEARVALALARPMARMQVEVERHIQLHRRSPVADLVSLTIHHFHLLRIFYRKAASVITMVIICVIYLFFIFIFEFIYLFSFLLYPESSVILYGLETTSLVKIRSLKNEHIKLNC